MLLQKFLMVTWVLIAVLDGCGLASATFHNFVITQSSLSYSYISLSLDSRCNESAGLYVTFIFCPRKTLILSAYLKTALKIEYHDQADQNWQSWEADTMINGTQHLISIQRDSIITLLRVENNYFQVKSFQPIFEENMDLEKIFFWNDFLILQEANSCRFYAERVDEIFSQLNNDFLNFPRFNLVAYPTNRCSQSHIRIIPSNKQILFLDFEFQLLISKIPKYNQKLRRLQLQLSWVQHLDISALNNSDSLQPSQMSVKQDICSRFIAFHNLKSGIASVFSMDAYYFVQSFNLNKGMFGFATKTENGSSCDSEESLTLFYLVYSNGLNDVNIKSVFLTRKFSINAIDLFPTDYTKVLTYDSRPFSIAIGYNTIAKTFQAGIILKAAPVIALNKKANNFTNDDLIIGIDMEFPPSFPCISPWDVQTDISRHYYLSYTSKLQVSIKNCVKEKLDLYCQRTLASHSQKEGFCSKCVENYELCQNSCIGQYFERSCALVNGTLIHAISEEKCVPSTLLLKKVSGIIAITASRASSDPINCSYVMPSFSFSWIGARVHKLQPQTAGAFNIKFFNFSSATYSDMQNSSRIELSPAVIPNSKILFDSQYQSKFVSFDLINATSYNIGFYYLGSLRHSYSFISQLSCWACLAPSLESAQISSGGKSSPSINSSIRIRRGWKHHSSASTHRSLLDESLGSIDRCGVQGGWNYIERNYIVMDWFDCPALINTEFCRLTLNASAEEYSIKLNSEYLFPSCKIPFSIHNTKSIQVTFDLFPHELLVLRFPKQHFVFSSTDESPKKLVGSSSYEDFGYFNLNFYSDNPKLSLANGKPRIFIRYRDDSLIRGQVTSLLFVVLKCLVFFMLVINIVFYYIRRQVLLEESDDDEIEEESPPLSPYQLIQYKDFHQKQLLLSENALALLSNAGITTERIGKVMNPVESECIICLDLVDEREYQIFLCGRHFVHTDCFQIWVEKMIEIQNPQLCPLRCQTILLSSDQSGRTQGFATESNKDGKLAAFDGISKPLETNPEHASAILRK